MKRLFQLIIFLVPCFLQSYSQTFNSNLPIVVINVDGGVTIPDEPRVFATMKVIKRGNGQRNYLTDQDSAALLNYNGRISIEIRGSSTQILPKKQYGLTTLMANDSTNNNVELLGLPKENDWVLNAMGFDPALLRDYICYNLSRKIGEYSSRTVYCELVINNSYCGLFLLQEKVKPGPDRVNVIKITKSDYFLPNLTGGYITKSDKTTGGDPVAWTMPSYVPNDDVMFIHVLPKPEEVKETQNDYIKGQFEKLSYAAGNGNTSFETGYPSIIDVRSFIDYNIISELSSNADSYQYSTYYHKDRNGKLRAGPLWDNDLTFGNDLFFWGLDRSHTDLWQVANGDNQGPYFWRDMFFNKEYKCSLSRRWLELTSPGQPLYSDSVIAFISTTAGYISEAVNRNNYTWNNFTNFNSEVQSIKSWLLQRYDWMNDQIGSLNGCPDPVIPPIVITKIMYNPDTTPAFPNSKDYEFVELKNSGNKIVSLSGDYFLGTGFVYLFPPYSMVPPGGVKVLASNEYKFRLKYGFAPSGQFTRNLSNDGEKLILADGFGNVIDYVDYSNAAPWPDANGNGAYLELTDTNLDNNDPANWIASHNVYVFAGVTPESDRIRLFPLPARNNVTLQSDETIEKADLFNIQGIILRSFNPNSSEWYIDLSAFPSGIYYIKVKTQSGVSFKKIVKE